MIGIPILQSIRESLDERGISTKGTYFDVITKTLISGL